MALLMKLLTLLLLLSLLTWGGAVGVGLPWSTLALLAAFASAAALALAAACGRSAHAAALTALLFLSFGALLFQPKVEWDGAAYYAQARSIAFDHDLDFGNEVQLFPSLQYLARKTPAKRIGLPFSFGPAAVWLTWLPAAEALGAGPTGREPAYLFLLAATAGLLGAGGLWLLSRSRPGDLPLLALVVMASPLPIYLWFQPAYSHAFQFAASALAAWWFVRLLRERLRTHGTAELLFLGLVSGAIVAVSFLMRWQGALVAIALAPPLLLITGRSTRNILAVGAAAAAAFLLCVLPQFLVIGATWGSYFTLPRIESDFVNLARPQLPALLFSTWNGLFFYHPVLLLGLVAALLLLRSKSPLPRFAVAGVLLWMLAEAYLVSCTLDWHGGGAFGQRRLIGFVPWLALMLAVWLRDLQSRPLKHALAALLFLLTVGNLLHAGAFAHYRIPPSPADVTNYVHTKRAKVYKLYSYGPALGDLSRGAGYFLEVALTGGAESAPEENDP